MQEVQLPHYRLQRNKNGAKAERKKRGRFARKPAPFLATFSRAFVSRLRHRAGVVRRETRREGCVRDKQKAQKPTIDPKGGAEANETAAKDPQVAGLQTTRAAQTPPLKRTLPRAGANEKTKRTRRRRTAKIFATKRQRYLAGEDRGMFHVLSVTKAQTKRPAKRRPFFRRMPDKSL